MTNINFNNLEECKLYVKEKLKETDYVTLEDVKNSISHYDEFIQYRKRLRYTLLNPTFYLLIEKPEPIWISNF